MLAAPLLAGNDLSRMNSETLAILVNRDAISIDQDRLGVQGDRLSAVGPLEIWSKPLSDGSNAVALFNRGELETPMTPKMSDVNLDSGQTPRCVGRQRYYCSAWHLYCYCGCTEAWSGTFTRSKTIAPSTFNSTCTGSDPR
jgi:hypothetical protein